MEPPGRALAADREVSHPGPSPADIPLEPPPARPDAPAGPMPPVSLLEAQFRAARGTDDRLDLLRQIADWNNAGALEALCRLFALERRPDVKLALIIDLYDIDPEAAPENRLALLSAALGDQPRNIRAAALDSLAKIEDRRVDSILKQTMSNDPDYALREQAAAIYRALQPDAAIRRPDGNNF